MVPEVEVEVWVTIVVRGKKVGFSSLGRFQDSRGVRKSVAPGEDGYCTVGVDSQTHSFHDLVCTAFHGVKSSPDLEAHHKDHDRTNNRPDNLCWVTHQKNIQESYRTQTRKSSGPQRSRQVLGRKQQSTEEWVPYPSMKAAAEELGLRVGSVSKVARGKLQHTGGYEFKLAPSPDLPGEVWKSLTVDTKKIQVSSLGRFMDTRGLKKWPLPDRSGYCRVSINRKTYYVHRLVCEAFWGPSLGLEVNHKDLNKSNNHYMNLEWVTRSYQIQHSYSTNKTRRSSAAKRSKPVYGRKDKTNDEWVEYPSINDAAGQLDVNAGNISKVTKGKLNQTGGYVFKLKPQE